MERPSHFIECAPTFARQRFGARKRVARGRELVSERKKIFASGKIFGKTCCIKPTNSYNYQQVIAVFACFTCNRSMNGFDLFAVETRIDRSYLGR
jgi:hypothetical protein